MNESRIEALLERIAVAVERLADHGIARGRFSTVESHEEAPATSDTHVTVPVVVPSSTPSVLESFLNAKGIRIKVAPTEDAADQIIDSLSLFLGVLVYRPCGN